MISNTLGYDLLFPFKYGGFKVKFKQPQWAEVWYDDNHYRLLIFFFCLPNMAIVAPTQNGTPKLIRVRLYSYKHIQRSVL